jgi:hypothetical protein
MLWGTSYLLDDPQCDVQFEKGLPVKNYFLDEISKTARYAMPFVRNIKYLMGKDACKPLIRSMGLPDVPPGVLSPEHPFVLREKPSEHLQCLPDSKEFKYFTDAR